jgi:hypothetical protein
MRTSGRRPKTARGRRVTSWLLCAVLVASLWRAPLPWIHRHEAASGHHHHVPTASFAWHLQHFHANGEQPEGWHVHLTWPWDVYRAPHGKPDPTSPAPAWVFEMPFVLLDGASISADHNASTAPPALLPATRTACDALSLDATPVCGLHFVQAYSAKAPLRALICVARC